MSKIKQALASARPYTKKKGQAPSKALQAHLKRRGLLPSTRKKYQEIINGADQSDLINWITRRIHSRTPIGTVLPLRAAVKHFLMAEHNYSEADLEELLPKAKGRKTKDRDGLTPHQLALYHAAVDSIDREPAHTILSLLPKTGLRISEACGLERFNIEEAEGHRYLVFHGKGDKPRVVPLVGSADRLLEEYQQVHGGERWLFVGYSGTPIGPHAIRKYTRRIAEQVPDLAGLSPHVLRHTFASMCLRKGMDLKRLQDILGHTSIKTTERYLHPTRQDLRDAMLALER